VYIAVHFCYIEVLSYSTGTKVSFIAVDMYHLLMDENKLYTNVEASFYMIVAKHCIV